MEVLKGKRILFACVPGDGHFNPLTGLAMHLRSLGCDVRWYSSMAYAKKLSRLSIPFYPFTKAKDVPADRIDEIFPERKQITNQVKKLVFDMTHFFILRSTEYLADIKDINSDWPVDALVADCVFSAIPFIKKELNIPVIAVGVLPLIQTSKDLAPSGLGMEPSYSFFGKVKQELLKTVANKVLFKKPNQLFFSLMDRYNIPSSDPNAFDALVTGATLFLQSGTPGLEYYRSDLGKNIRYIGPLLPYTEKKADNVGKWYDARVEQYKKVILVTQGTVEKESSKLLAPVLEAFKETETLVIVTTGGSQTKELQDRYPHPNIIIKDNIPFGDVMPYAHLFITNGGFGGVMQGIQHGLPMIVAGVHEGKNEICARIGFLKYGINLHTETPKTEQIKAAAEKIFRDDTYKTNVMRLKDEFAAYNVNELFAGYVHQAMSM